MYPVKKTSRGFTLVEMLVSIGIIAILSSVVYASLASARKGARDDERKANLKELQLAIEMYKAQYGQYPAACQGDNAWSGSESGSYSCPGQDYIIGLVPQFIDALPYDQNQTGNWGYLYRTSSSGGIRNNYKLLSYAVVESKTVKSFEDEFARCPQDYGTSWCGATPNPTVYAVYSAGAANW